MTAVMVGRLARSCRRLPVSCLFDPGDRGRRALFAPRRLGLRCIGLDDGLRLGLRGSGLIGRAFLAGAARLVVMAPMSVAGAAASFAARLAGFVPAIRLWRGAGLRFLHR